jgi:hypothetical protein
VVTTTAEEKSWMRKRNRVSIMHLDMDSLSENWTATLDSETNMIEVPETGLLSRISGKEELWAINNSPVRFSDDPVRPHIFLKMAMEH